MKQIFSCFDMVYPHLAFYTRIQTIFGGTYTNENKKILNKLNAFIITANTYYTSSS